MTMKNFPKILLLVLLGLALSLPCDASVPSSDKNISKWPPVLGPFDELLHRFDREHIASRRQAMVDTLYALAKSHPEHAALSWRVILCQNDHNHYTSSSEKELTLAINMMDTTKFQYDYMRLRFLHSKMLDSHNVAKFEELMKLRDYFSGIGDYPILFRVNADLGLLFKDIGNYGRSLQYYSEAARLCKEMGDDQAYNLNNLNIATLTGHMGDAPKAYSMLRDLEKTSARYPRDEGMLANLYMSMYTYTSSTAEKERTSRLAVRNAEVMGDPVYLSMAMYNRAEYFQGINRPDSVISILSDPRSLRGCTMSPYVAQAVWAMKAKAYEHIGQIDSAYSYLQRHMAIRDSLESIAGTVQQAAINLDIAQYEHTIAAEKDTNTRKIVVISALLFVVLCVAVVLLIRLRRKHRENRLKTRQNRKLQSEIVQTSQALLSTEMRLETAGNALGDIKNVLQTGGSAAEEIDRIARLHRASQASWDAFSTYFDKIHPNLLECLQKNYPGLTQRDLRICAYVVLGLDNREIANLTGVLPESVKRQKNRIRKRLGLTDPTASLALYIKSVCPAPDAGEEDE